MTGRREAPEAAPTQPSTASGPDTPAEPLERNLWKGTSEMREERTSSALPPTSGHGLSPAERILRARLAAHTMHAQHDTR
jgi:hypothetical protein